MLKRKKKQKSKHTKIYQHPQHLLFLLIGWANVLTGLGFGLQYGAETVIAVSQGASSRTIISGIFSTIAVATFFPFMGWVAIQASKVVVILSEKDVIFMGLGVRFFARWDDVLRIECKHRWFGQYRQVRLVASQIKKTRTWWSIGDHTDDIPLYHVISEKEAGAIAQGASHPLIEDILQHAPHVEIVEVGERKKKKKWWIIG